MVKLGISLAIHCFGTAINMASRFATVSDDDILATNKSAIPTNNNTKFGLAKFTGTGLKNYFLTEFKTKS